MLPSGLTLAPVTPAVLGLYVPDLTHGFPAVMTTNRGTSYATAGVALDGDAECTMTYITRVPYYPESGAPQHIMISGLNVGMGFRNDYGSWLSVFVNNGAVAYWKSYPAGWGLTPAVITLRVGTVSSTNLAQRLVVTFNGTMIAPYISTQIATASPASVLSLGMNMAYPYYWHEVIFFRAALTDSEVTAMHTRLMRQYGIGV